MVDHFLDRLVDKDVPANARKQLLAYVAAAAPPTGTQSSNVTAKLDAKALEGKMRGLLHLIMTLPTYQLS